MKTMQLSLRIDQDLEPKIKRLMQQKKLNRSEAINRFIREGQAAQNHRNVLEAVLRLDRKLSKRARPIEHEAVAILEMVVGAVAQNDLAGALKTANKFLQGVKSDQS